MITYEEVMDAAMSRWQKRVEKGDVIEVYLYDEDLAVSYLIASKGKRDTLVLIWREENDKLVEGRTPFPPNGWPLYWPPFIQDSPEAPAFLVVPGFYGEECANRMSTYGLIATSSLWGAYLTDFWPLAGRDVFIWPSNTDGRIREVHDYTEKLRAMGCRVKVLDVDVLNLPAGGNFLDWERLHGDATQEAIEALLVENGL